MPLREISPPFLRARSVRRGRLALRELSTPRVLVEEKSADVNFAEFLLCGERVPLFGNKWAAVMIVREGV